MFVRSMLHLFSLVLLLNSNDPDPGKDPKDPPPENKDPKDPEVKFDEKQQEKVNALIAAARREAADKAKADAKTEADAAQAKADAEAKRKADEDKGNYETAKATLTQERDTAVTERDTFKGRVETLEGLAKERLDELLKGLPKELAELGPDESTPVEQRLAWAEKAAKVQGQQPGNPGNGPNRKPSPGTFDRDEAIQKSRQTGRFKI